MPKQLVFKVTKEQNGHGKLKNVLTEVVHPKNPDGI